MIAGKVSNSVAVGRAISVVAMASAHVPPISQGQSLPYGRDWC